MIFATLYVYGAKDMTQQFKMHLLCLFEASNIAIYHASLTHLESIDELQSRFLKDIGLTEEAAFLKLNMVPPEAAS